MSIISHKTTNATFRLGKVAHGLTNGFRLGFVRVHVPEDEHAGAASNEADDD